MATVTDPDPVASGVLLAATPRLFTAADLAALPTDLPSGPIDYELDEGRIIVVSPAGQRHGSLELRLGSALLTQGEERGLGQAFTGIGVVLGRGPDNVFAPDVVYVVASRLPVRESAEGYLDVIPDLVAEVRSKNDSAAHVARKVEVYLAAGVRVAWVIDPCSRTVQVHRAGESPRTLTDQDTLDAAGVIPDFQLPLAKLFGPPGAE